MTIFATIQDPSMTCRHRARDRQAGCLPHKGILRPSVAPTSRGRWREVRSDRRRRDVGATTNESPWELQAGNLPDKSCPADCGAGFQPALRSLRSDGLPGLQQPQNSDELGMAKAPRPAALVWERPSAGLEREEGRFTAPPGLPWALVSAQARCPRHNGQRFSVEPPSYIGGMVVGSEVTLSSTEP